MATFKFENIYINDYYLVTGPIESNSRLKNIDLKIDDYYFKEKTFEKAEVKMQKVALEGLLHKLKLKKSDINFLVGGDLVNQIAATSYAIANENIPFLGIYGACATYPESLIISSILLDKKEDSKVIAITSAHNLTAERQFRYPVEYGSIKPHTATFTATSSVATMLSKEKGKLRIESATIGTVVDLGVKDAFNLGAAMVPACAKTLYEHLFELKRDISYYDLILTGDLGCSGSEVLKEYYNITYGKKIKNHLDSGCELYLKSQNTYAGGSGPACLPLVLFGKILTSKKYKKILIIGTGALHNPTYLNQKNTIPSIAHAVSLEVVE